ncbi:MAG: hypothetical protein IT449_09640 [Phycisphaerales bacterium]|nr:hypothetical protein [Phycisphaerales bacterium]
MGKKGPKIKELARELGVTSHRILEHCRREGVPAQNSASRLDLPTADRVRVWFKGATPHDAGGIRGDDDAGGPDIAETDGLLDDLDAEAAAKERRPS